MLNPFIAQSMNRFLSVVVQLAIALAIGSAVISADRDEIVHFQLAENGSVGVLGWASGDLQLIRFPQMQREKPIANFGKEQLGSVAISSDGRIVVVASASAPWFEIWDTATPRKHKRVNVPNLISALKISPDGKTVAVCGQFQLQLYNLAEGKPAQRLDNVHQCKSITWASNSKLIAIMHDQHLQVWFPSKNKVLLDSRWPTAVGGWTDLSFSADGRLLATRVNQYTSIWDVAKGKSIREFSDSTTSVRGMAWGPNLDSFITCTESEFCIRDRSRWQSEENSEIGNEITSRQPLDFPSGPVQFSRDGRVAAWLENNVRQPEAMHFARIESTTEGDLAAVVETPQQSAWKPADLKVVDKVIWNDPKVHRLDGQFRKPTELPSLSTDKSLPNAQASARSMALSGNAMRVAVGGADGEVFIGTPPSGKIVSRFRCSERDTIERITISPDGSRVAIWQGGETLDLWSANGKPLARLPIEDGLKVMRFSPLGSFLLLGGEEKVWMFRCSDWSLIQSLTFEGGYVTAFAVSRDESLVAVGVTNSIFLWDITHDQILWRAENGALGVSGLAISPSKTKLVADYSSPVSELYDIATGQRLILKDVMLESPAFIDDDRIIGGNSTKELLIVSSDDLSTLETIAHPSGGVNIEAYSNELQINDTGNAALFRGHSPFLMTDLRFWAKANP